MADPAIWFKWLAENPLVVVVFALATVIVVTAKAFWTHVMIPVKDAVIKHMGNLDTHLSRHAEALDSLVLSNEKISSTLTALCKTSESQAEWMDELRQNISLMSRK
jgi:hypothetical protein